MTLLEATEKLGELDREQTIYAARPWSPQSLAAVASEPDGGGVPPLAAQGRMAYFIEVFIAADFLRDWERTLQRKPSAAERCQRLIDYATNDA